MEKLGMTYDLAIIGAGSAGLSLAAAAAQFGEKIVLFEKGDMGGDCLNTGCVPSKALLAVAKTAHTMRSANDFGLPAYNPAINYSKAMEYVQSVIKTIAPIDSQDRFEKLGVTVVRATAKFVGQTSIEANGQTFTARRIIIATGTRPFIPPLAGLADVAFFTTETIFKNRVHPRHLIIIGGGAIGLEMAQAHIRLGCKVTVLEAFEFLAKDDAELVCVVVESLKAEGADLRGGAKISKVAATQSGITVTLEDGATIKGTHLLVAAGRIANIENLNLDAAGVHYNKRGLIVDDALRTCNKAIYAAGDVAGGLQFTHVASYHAGLIIRHALFKLPIKNRTTHIPWVTYTDPELAHVGLSEAAARQQFGHHIRVLRWPFKHNDRAQADHKKTGFVKIITTKNGRILGVDIVGQNAGELIAPWVLALSKKLKISAMANLVLPYPTYSEAGKRAGILFYAGFADKKWLRQLIGFLKVLG
jgi:pyruvate/2-oxoglutarate dehydrogenase complex dihydrolipoamide dehydrogenase (E3) component